MIEPRVSLQAYCKMMLHAAKYPHAAVNGLLLAAAPKDLHLRKGTTPQSADDNDDAGVDDEDDAQPSSRKTALTSLNITDSIPLFHQVGGYMC